MASAQVTLKLTPHELQIVSAALKMYAYAYRHINRDGYDHPLQGFQHDLSIIDGGNPDKALLAANTIRQQIDLK